MSKKYYMVLDDYEHSLLIHALNDKRNELIQDGKYTDAVDEVLVKVVEASRKKFKIKNVEG
ncbi:MAG: hypothetical protein PHR92_02425 [Lachnospiraceae bacterium]|nr:hypothetical protein [Lachnospiraceae bacterium]